MISVNPLIKHTKSCYNYYNGDFMKISGYILSSNKWEFEFIEVKCYKIFNYSLRIIKILI